MSSAGSLHREKEIPPLPPPKKKHHPACLKRITKKQTKEEHLEKTQAKPLSILLFLHWRLAFFDIVPVNRCVGTSIFLFSSLVWKGGCGLVII